MKLTIKRSEWYRGQGFTLSRLVLSYPKDSHDKCCLGFYCLEKGFTVENLRGLTSPQRLSDSLGIALDDLLASDGTNNSVVAGIIRTNDFVGYSEEEREQLLIEAFAQLTPPCEVTFVD